MISRAVVLEDLKTGDFASFAELGAKWGVSRQRAHQRVRELEAELGPKVIRDIFKGKRERKLQAEQERDKERTRMLDRDWRRKHASIFTKARSCGYSVRSVWERNAKHPTIEWYSARINGRLCSLHNVTQQWSKTRKVYTRVTLSLSALAGPRFVIFHTNVPGYRERFFIVPRKILRRAFFGEDAGSRIVASLYLPVDQSLPYNNHHPRVDFWKYENRWDLLQ